MIAKNLKTALVIVVVGTICLLSILRLGMSKAGYSLSSKFLAISSGPDGSRSAQCSLDNHGSRGLLVGCDYYEIKTAEGWSARDEYDLPTWYVPSGSSLTVVIPAPSRVTNIWRIRWRYSIPVTNQNIVEHLVDKACSKLRRYSFLTPPRFVTSSEIK
jgi:hypothetical protein